MEMRKTTQFAKIMLAVWLSLSSSSLALQVLPAPNSPDDVLDRFYNMINAGGLLTAQGWAKGAKLFEHERAIPEDKRILVTTKHPLGNGPIGVMGTRAEADEKWVDSLGFILSDFTYAPPPNANVKAEGEIFIWKLVLTNKHWEAGSDGKSEIEVTGPPEWRIEGSLNMRFASKEAAIRYLQRKQGEATDAHIKANAGRTISILQKLPAFRSHT
jgi:hypothetical protein